MALDIIKGNCEEYNGIYRKYIYIIKYIESNLYLKAQRYILLEPRTHYKSKKNTF